MNINAKEQIKSLLALRNMTLKTLAQLISEKTGKECSYTGLSKRIGRGTIYYNEVMIISDILDYEISYKDLKRV